MWVRVLVDSHRGDSLVIDYSSLMWVILKIVTIQGSFCSGRYKPFRGHSENLKCIKISRIKNDTPISRMRFRFHSHGGDRM